MSRSMTSNPLGATTVVPVTPTAQPSVAPDAGAPGDLPPAFEMSLKRMLASGFGEGREMSMSALVGAALVRFGKIEQSVAKIAGGPNGSPHVTVTLDPQLQTEIFGKLAALNSAVSTDEQDLATTKQRLAETEHRLARLEEHVGHLRAHYEALANGAAEITERVAVIQRDHGRVTEELAAVTQRIEPLEHRKRGS
jgi:hypothetical protein